MKLFRFSYEALRQRRERLIQELGEQEYLKRVVEWAEKNEIEGCREREAQRPKEKGQ